jgi:hypothetical protein
MLTLVPWLGVGLGLSVAEADPAFRTIVVSSVPEDPAASGVALREAYDSVTNATAQYPVVLFLGPGLYDLGPTPLKLDKPHVDLEGSGRDVTSITGSGFEVLLVTADVRLSRVSVENLSGDGLHALDGFVDLSEVGVRVIDNGTSSFATGIDLRLRSSARMRDVRIHAENQDGSGIGVQLLGDGAPVVMENVTISVVFGGGGSAVQIGTRATLQNVDIDSNNVGVSIIGSGMKPEVRITDSRIDGTTQAGIVAGSNGPSRLLVQRSSISGTLTSLDFWSLSSADIVIIDTLLSSQVRIEPPNRIRCVGAYDASFAPLDSACQPQQ